MKSYSYGKQSIDDSDLNAVLDTLKSGWLTQGPKVKQFETDLKKRFGAKNALAVANGTAGLHLIGLALGWKPGDIVITTPLTFLASANCILYCGATPDFVDIENQTFTIDVGLLELKLKLYQTQNKKVTAVIAVDFAGHPCAWRKLQALSQKYEFDLVDDACHAIGAKYDGVEICSSQFAKAVNLSFHPVKSMTTGEGGAVLTNDSSLATKIEMLRTHGMTKDPAVMEKNDGPWYYEMHELGFNYRITDFQCALGSSQLKRLNQFNRRRHEIAKYYNEHLDTEMVTTPLVKPEVEHSYHLYALQLKLEKLTCSREKLFLALREHGLNLQVHYYPVHLQPYYKKNFGFKLGDFPVAEGFYSREISLPIYPDLDDADLDYICKHINLTLKAFSR